MSDHKVKSVCVIGGRGSIGRRYCAILKYLGIEPIVYEMEHSARMEELPEADGYIIATPTETHMHFVRLLISKRAYFLCEKPLSKNVDECREVAWYQHGLIVNNYAFVIQPGKKVEYNYYNTGRDGLEWDVCQLLYLDPEAVIRTDSPLWHLTANGEMIPYRWVERSYVQMLGKFIERETTALWPLSVGEDMAKVVLERIHANRALNSSAK